MAINPYALSFINVGLSILFLLSLLFYKYIFSKKINLFIILVLISLLPIWSIFRNGDYESGDFNIHVYRSVSFYESLKEGQFLPTWSRDLNATYGYETFLIGGPLEFYITSIFHTLGASFILSLKLLLAASFIASGITMYFWIKEFFDKFLGFIASIFYLFAPFHLVDLHFRVSPGDMLAYVFLPLIAYANLKLFKKLEAKYFFIGSIGVFLLMISHPISLVAMTFIVLYILSLFFIYKYPIKNLILTFLSLGYGLLMSSYFWAPIILEKEYVITSLQNLSVTFENFSLFFFTPWRFGLLFQGPNGQLSFLLGYAQILLILFVIYFLYKKVFNKQQSRMTLFFLIYLAIVLFLFLPVSIPIWQILPFYKSLEFSYRLSFIVVVLTSILSAIAISKIKSKLLIGFICSVAIISTVLNWGHRRVIPEITDTNLINGLPFSTATVEGGNATTTIWVNPKHPWMNEIPKQHLEVLKGDSLIKNVKRLSILHEYSVEVKTDSYLKENTYYYPGWQLTVDGKPQEINFTNTKYPGIMTFYLNKGVHEIKLTFKDTPIRKAAKFVSFTAFFLLLLTLPNINTKRINR